MQDIVKSLASDYPVFIELVKSAISTVGLTRPAIINNSLDGIEQERQRVAGVTQLQLGSLLPDEL